MKSCGKHLKFPRPFPIYLEESHFGVMNIACISRGALVWLLRNQTKGFKGERRCNGNEWKYNLWQHLTHMGNWKRLGACIVDKIIFSFLSIHSCQRSLNSLNCHLAVNYVFIHKIWSEYVYIIQGDQKLRNSFWQKLFQQANEN